MAAAALAGSWLLVPLNALGGRGAAQAATKTATKDAIGFSALETAA
jgi:hypothetical protein